MIRIQSAKKLFFKLSVFEHMRSHLLQFLESSILQRNGYNDKLVPIKAVFSQKQKRLKPLVDSLELWWDSKEIFGMPKGGLDTPCSLVLALVLCVLETALLCSLRAQIYR